MLFPKAGAKMLDLPFPYGANTGQQDGAVRIVVESFECPDSMR